MSMLGERLPPLVALVAFPPSLDSSLARRPASSSVVAISCPKTRSSSANLESTCDIVSSTICFCEFIDAMISWTLVFSFFPDSIRCWVVRPASSCRASHVCDRRPTFFSSLTIDSCKVSMSACTDRRDELKDSSAEPIRASSLLFSLAFGGELDPTESENCPRVWEDKKRATVSEACWELRSACAACCIACATYPLH